MSVPSFKRRTIFSPTQISGCQLWLDAADSNTLTLSGSSVTAWNDKSGNNYHMNTLTPSARWTGSAAYPTIGTSINGLQTVNFVAQSGLKQGTTLDGVKNLFWVGRIAAPVGSGDVSYILLGHDTNYDWHSNQYGGKFVHVSLTQSGIYNASPTSLFTSDVNAIRDATFSSVNMPTAPNVSLLSVAGITGTTRYQGICYDRSDNLGWCGDLAEVIIFSTALSVSDRQTVEGYLAQKWGLTGSLPPFHAGLKSKIFPSLPQNRILNSPVSSVFSPTSITGCSMWLDGNDPAGTGVKPSNGSLISTWFDKSGTGNTLTAASAQPTFTTSAQNGQAVITFNGSQNISKTSLSGSSFAGTAQNISVFIVFSLSNTNNSSSYSCPFCWANGTGVPRIAPTWEGAAGWQMDVGLNNPIRTSFTSPVLQTNNTFYMSSYWKNGGSTQLNINGSNGASATGQDTTNLSGYSYDFNVGNGFTNASYWMKGNIGEIIFYNTTLSSSNFRQVEGYLAWKWGLQSNLPGDHLHKAASPTSTSTARMRAILNLPRFRLISSGLVNRWIFNNGSGSTVTDSVGGQNISLSGTYTWSSSVPNSEIAAGSLSFNGYSGTGSAPLNATLQTSTYTMTLWYYHTGVSDPRGGNPMILQSGFNQNEAFSFATGGFTGTSKPYFYSSVYNGGFGRTFSSVTPLNTWTHLAVTIGNSTYNAYQNGVLDSGNTNISITSGLPLTLNGSFIFAKGDSAYGNRFGGSLFDVRIYNRALTASEISQIYNGTG